MRTGKINIILLIIVVLALAGGGVVLARHLSELSGFTARARGESAQQSGEIDACKARLQELHAAWAKYREDHDEASPPSVDALVPDYLTPDQLICPTATRWRGEGGIVEAGSINVDGETHMVTYGFMWLSAGYPRLEKRLGDEVPLINCQVHREVTYRKVYGKAPSLGAFSPDERKKLIRDVADEDVLTIRRTGQIDVLREDEE